MYTRPAKNVAPMMNPIATITDQYLEYLSVLEQLDVGAVGGEHSSLERFRAHTSRVKVMSSTGSWDSPAPDVTPTCITCHKAHGSDQSFGLIWKLPPTGETRHACEQCHNKAPVLTTP